MEQNCENCKLHDEFGFCEKLVVDTIRCVVKDLKTIKAYYIDVREEEDPRQSFIVPKDFKCIFYVCKWDDLTLKKWDNLTLKKCICEVLEKLDTSNYIDPAEHAYDAIKGIKRHLDDDNLEYYIHDFLWGLENSTVLDVDGDVKECCNLIRECVDNIKNKR